MFFLTLRRPQVPQSVHICTLCNAHCRSAECKTAFARVTTEGQSKTKEEVQSLMATLLRSDDLSDSEVSVFKSLSGDTEDAVVEMASCEAGGIVFSAMSEI